MAIQRFQKAIPDVNPYVLPIVCCPTCHELMAHRRTSDPAHPGPPAWEYVCQNPNTACNYRFTLQPEHAKGECKPILTPKPQPAPAPEVKGTGLRPVPGQLAEHVSGRSKTDQEPAAEPTWPL